MKKPSKAKIPAGSHVSEDRQPVPSSDAGAADQRSGEGLEEKTGSVPPAGAVASAPASSVVEPDRAWDLALGDAFVRQYPLMSAAARGLAQRLPEGFPGTVMLRVTAKRDNFRRAGVSHSGTVDYSLTTFQPAQIEQLFAEPHLLVSFVPVEAS